MEVEVTPQARTAGSLAKTTNRAMLSSPSAPTLCRALSAPVPVLNTTPQERVAADYAVLDRTARYDGRLYRDQRQLLMSGQARLSRITPADRPLPFVVTEAQLFRLKVILCWRRNARILGRRDKSIRAYERIASQDCCQLWSIARESHYHRPVPTPHRKAGSDTKRTDRLASAGIRNSYAGWVGPIDSRGSAGLWWPASDAQSAERRQESRLSTSNRPCPPILPTRSNRFRPRPV